MLEQPPWYDIDWENLTHINNHQSRICRALDTMKGWESVKVVEFNRALDLLWGLNPREHLEMNTETLPYLYAWTLELVTTRHIPLRFKVLRHLYRILHHIKSEDYHAETYTSLWRLNTMVHLLNTCAAHVEGLLGLLATTTHAEYGTVLDILAEISTDALNIVLALLEIYYVQTDFQRRTLILSTIEHIIYAYDNAVSPRRFREDWTEKNLATLRWIMGQVILFEDHADFVKPAAMIYLVCSPSHLPMDVLDALARLIAENLVPTAQVMKRCNRLPFDEVAYLLNRPDYSAEQLLDCIRELLLHTGQWKATLDSVLRPDDRHHVGARLQRVPASTRQAIWMQLILLHCDAFWQLDSNLLSAVWGLGDSREALHEHLLANHYRYKR